MFYGLFFISKSLVMIILPFGTRSGKVRSRSGHLRSNFKVIIFAQKWCLSYAECHGESNGVLSFALGSIVSWQIQFENFGSLHFLRHSGIKYKAIELIFGM